MSDQHKFRYLLQPGTNFQFVNKFKVWVLGSLLLMAASIGVLFVNKQVRGDYMNWTIDFKGGTELIYSFKDSSGTYVKPDLAQVRKTLRAAGEDGVELSEMTYQEDAAGGKAVTVNGLQLRSPRFSALKEEQREKVRSDFVTKFADREIGKANWSGDRLYVRSMKPLPVAEAAPVFTANGFELKTWGQKEAEQYAHPDEGTGEYNQVFSVWGLDRQYQKILEAGLPGTVVHPVQSYGVGAKAGEKLRNDAAKSLIYAIFLIMLYLAFRFDIRYAPGAAFATIHDAVMVIGVFAVTWTEVSLVSVAGLLTVIGFSVNDTVVVFDRIRENQFKLKDKKLERVIDISINEMLVRTILTSTTVFATTLVMNIFGTGMVRNFAFAMNIGVIVGVYSSMFLAAPLFLWISKKWYSGPPKARAIPASVLAAEKASAAVEKSEKSSSDE